MAVFAARQRVGGVTSVTPIPVRLDVDVPAAGFVRAMSQLDRASVTELERVGLDFRIEAQ
jgi:hypothetical protein